MEPDNKLGKQAEILISEYPLYASTSNITYDEMIEVAKVFYPDTKEWADIIQEIEQ